MAIGKTAATVAMKGAGYYSRSTRGAKDVIDNAMGMLLEATSAIPAPPMGLPLHIADFGAADGGTSKKAIYETIAALRHRFPERQIELTYTDLPSNDYSNLFKNMLGLIPDETRNYLDDFTGVFINAIGIGFHRQLLPDASLDIGFSATAMHYISEKPCEISNHVHMIGATGDTLAAYAKRAAQDWQNILISRAHELRPGGRLVFMNFGKDEAGQYLGHTGGVNMFDTFDMLWAGMRDEGLITGAEYTNASFPQYYRTKEEFCAPFADETSPVRKAGLRLISAHTGVIRCPYRAAYEAAKGAMSAAEFARSYIPTLRSWSETVFLNALGPDRAAPEKSALVDEFYQRYENLVAQNPDGHAMDYVHCYIAIEKPHEAAA